jgi:UDP-N-acetylmuramate dehydrogenase
VGVTERVPGPSDAIELAAALLGPLARRHVALGPLTTYKVGGAAALYVEAAADEDLTAVASAVQASGVPLLVVGKGSNLLVADVGFPGVAVALGSGYDWLTIEETTVHAGGATSLPVVARRSASAGLRGLEWAVGVPGSVGGAVRMNAGGHGSDMAAALVGCRVVDLIGGGSEVLDVERLAYGYRRSSIRATQVVVEAWLRAAAGDRRAAEAEVADIVRWRRQNQPGGHNAGSIFTNPPGETAGRLVEVAGCKGWRRGSAEVSAKHANFIQCDEQGSADDVLALIVDVAAQVERCTGVRLATEIRLVGFPGTYPQLVDDQEAEGS